MRRWLCRTGVPCPTRCFGSSRVPHHSESGSSGFLRCRGAHASQALPSSSARQVLRVACHARRRPLQDPNLVLDSSLYPQARGAGELSSGSKFFCPMLSLTCQLTLVTLVRGQGEMERGCRIALLYRNSSLIPLFSMAIAVSISLTVQSVKLWATVHRSSNDLCVESGHKAHSSASSRRLGISATHQARVEVRG